MTFGASQDAILPSDQGKSEVKQLEFLSIAHFQVVIKQ